jgi:phosphatidylglycerophosphate synthase
MMTATVNVPNAISTLRIGMVPVLLWLAWHRQGAFTVVLAATLVSDILDGFLARRLNQQTRLGAQLDSWGDFLIVLVYPFAALWLRPDELQQNAAYAIVAAVSYGTPILFGFLRYRRLTSYHTRLMTITAYVMGVAMVCFFAGWSAIPFRFGCLLLLVAALEEILISALLPRWVENVASYRMALALRRQMRARLPAC